MGCYLLRFRELGIELGVRLFCEWLCEFVLAFRVRGLLLRVGVFGSVCIW